MNLKRRINQIERRRASKSKIVVIGWDEAPPPPQPELICIVDPRFPKARGLRNHQYGQSTEGDQP